MKYILRKVNGLLEAIRASVSLIQGEWKYKHTVNYRYALSDIYLYLQPWKKNLRVETMRKVLICTLHLPELDRGKYTIKFIYHGSQKHHLLPCNKTFHYG